jgi:hypothetical protein
MFLTFINHRTSRINLPQDWGYYKRFTRSKFATRGVSANIPSTPFPSAAVFHWRGIAHQAQSYLMHLERRSQGTIRKRNYLLRRYSLVQICQDQHNQYASCFPCHRLFILHRDDNQCEWVQQQIGADSMPPLVCLRQRESSYHMSIRAFFQQTRASAHPRTSSEPR